MKVFRSKLFRRISRYLQDQGCVCGCDDINGSTIYGMITLFNGDNFIHERELVGNFSKLFRTSRSGVSRVINPITKSAVLAFA